MRGRGASSKRDERHAEDRARRRPQRLLGRVGSAQPRRERDGGAERVGGAEQRADVARIGDAPEREADVARPRRGRSAARKTPIARGGCGASRLREQLGLDVLAGDEQLDRLDAGRARRLDEILALADEQARLVALAASRSLRTSFSRGLDAEVITRAASRASRRGSRRADELRRSPPGQVASRRPQARRRPVRGSAARRRRRAAPSRAGRVERARAARSQPLARRGSRATAVWKTTVSASGRPLGEQPGQQLDVVAADELGRIARAATVDRPVEPLEPLVWSAQTKTLQEQCAVVAS